MSRRGKLGTNALLGTNAKLGIIARLGIIAVIAAALVRSAGSAGAVVVVGTGNPAVDVPAVQAAVDQGGEITLSGTFDFGTHSGNHIIVPGRAGLDQDVRGQSTVFIHRADVVISGETDGSGNPITVIRNGMPPFWIGWDGIILREQPPGTPNVDYGIEDLPQDHDGRIRYRDSGQDPGYEGDQRRYAIPFPDVSATIQHIYFESPLHYGVKAAAGRNIAILDNVFVNVQWGGLVHAQGLCPASHFALACAFIGEFYAPFIHPAVRGNAVIARNRIDTVGTEIINIHQGECFGIMIYYTDTAPIATQNEIRNIGRDAQGSGPHASPSGAILVCDNRGGTSVTENTIDNSDEYGIWDLSAYILTPADLLAGNVIRNCASAGIRAETYGVTSASDIQDNFVSDCTGGIWAATHAGTIVGNVIRGSNRGLTLSRGPLTVGRNTILESTDLGIVGYSIPLSLAGNVVAGNGRGVQLPSGTDPSRVRCNDLWTNSGGNWFGISDQTGANGNFSADPLFCCPAMRDYTLADTSPCLPGNHPYGADCDTVGALGWGCDRPAGVFADGPVNRTVPAASLLGPWPNPSSGALRFAVLLDDPSNAKVTLLSVTGRVVGTIVDRQLPRGAHGFSWDLPDMERRGIPGGVYYLRLEAAGQTQTKKLVLTR